MGTLGGAGTHALIGMRVWADALGFAAVVGTDFTAEQHQQLAKLGIDLRGVHEEPACKTVRALQILEEDDRHIEFMRTDLADFFRYTPRFELLPSDYVQARGVHLMWGETETFEELWTLLDQWRSANPDAQFVWEPALEYLNGSAEEFGQLFRRFDLVSPDLEQAESMTGRTDPVEMAKELLAWGAPIVAIRMGAEGSIVCAASGECWQLPAVSPAQLIDVTGAGNAYCGGFIVELGEGLSIQEAALRGAVSVSFALEPFGVPEFDEQTQEEAARRLVWAREHIHNL